MSYTHIERILILATSARTLWLAGLIGLIPIPGLCLFTFLWVPALLATLDSNP